MKTALAALAMSVSIATVAAHASSVAGRVVDGRAQPLAGALVVATDAATEIRRSAVTDRDGRYEIGGVTAGRLTVTATLPGFLPANHGATRPGGPGGPIALADGQSLDNIDITMFHGAAIGGRIASGRGQALPGVEVAALRILPGNRVTQVVTTTVSDRLGNYRLSSLPPGTYVVRAALPGAAAGSTVAAMSSEEIDRALAALAKRTTAAPQDPVSVLNSRPSLLGSAPVFMPGVWSLEQAATVRLDVGQEFSGADVAVERAPLVTVSGSISGLPVSQAAHVALVADNGRGSGALAQQAAVTGAGQFSFSNVAPGRYILRAGAGDLAGETTIDVGGRHESGVSVHLAPTMGLAGRIVLSSEAGTSTPPLARFRFTLSSPTDDAIRISVERGLIPARYPTPSAEIDVDGSFRVTGLQPGRLAVKPAAPAGWWLQSATLGGREGVDSGFLLAPDNSATLVLTFSNRVTAVTGVIGGLSSHQPAPHVLMFPADRQLWGVPTKRLRATRPDSGGRFVIEGLPPGDYALAVVVALGPDDLLDTVFLEDTLPYSVRVSLGDGEHKTQNLQLGASPASPFDGLWIVDRQRNAAAIDKGVISGTESMRLTVSDGVLTIRDNNVETKYPLDGSPVKRRIGARELVARARQEADRIVITTDTVQGARIDAYSVDGNTLRIDSTLPGQGNLPATTVLFVRRTN